MSDPINFFGLHGTHVRGDDPRERAEQAKLLMWHARHLQALTGVPVYALTQQDANGWARAQIAGTDQRVLGDDARQQQTEPVPRKGGYSRLCWMPEGFVFLPRTPAAPNGWGLPREAPDQRGTLGGDFPFLHISRYEHANYPEYLHEVYSDPERETHRRLNWPLHYQSYEEDSVGAVRNGAVLPQMTSRWLPFLTERRQTQWFMHWPYSRGYKTPAEQAVHESTNALRSEVGKPPLAFALVGWTVSLAAAVVMEGARAGVLGHDSQRYRVGWQSLLQRAGSSYGAIMGENIAAGVTPNWRGAPHGEAMFAAWRGSPDHYQNMTRDWTDGARALANTPNWTWTGSWSALNRPPLMGAQLLAEVVDVSTQAPARLSSLQRKPYAVWPPLVQPMTPASQSLGAQVFSSALSLNYLISRRVWSHPKLGDLHIHFDAAQPMNSPLQRNMFSRRDYVRYKQTVLQLVKPPVDDDDTGLRAVIGACLYQDTPNTHPEDAYNLLRARAAEKKRREAAYNARRHAAGLSFDHATQNTEYDLSWDDVRRETHLQYLVYEETGSYEHDSVPRPAPRLTLHRTKDFYLADPEALANATTPLKGDQKAVFTLPTTMLEIGPAAASRDGRRMVVAYSELAGSPQTRWHAPPDGSYQLPAVNPVVGERLKFVEFVNDTPSVVEESTLPVTVTCSREFYRHEIKQRVHLIPFYGAEFGNTLQFVDMDLDCWCDTRTGRRLQARLVFPGGPDFVFADTSATVSAGPGLPVETGVVRDLVYLDPLRPDRAVYIEYEMGAASVTVRLKAGINTPSTLRTLATRAQMHWSDRLPTLYPFAGRVLNDHAINLPGFAGEIPGENYLATFWHGTAGAGNRADSVRYANDWSPYCMPLAPLFVGSHIWWRGWPQMDQYFQARIGPAGVIQIAESRDDYIVAGWLDENVAGALDVTGEDRYFWHSSIDLKQVTGIPDLKNNILPLWSL